MIKARVIRIVSSKQLIFNAGSADGVRRGMKFGVYSPAEPIVDPETGETLGEYRAWKVTLEPDTVYERFTIASQPYRDSGDDYPGDEGFWPDLHVDHDAITPFASGNIVAMGDAVEQMEAELSPSPGDDDIPF